MNVTTQLELTLQEQNELERCEVVIRQGLETFVEVGTALMTIRDKRLYRVEFRTFEDYLEQKWDIKRRHGYRLIDAAVVVSNVSNWTQTPATESQARPLTQLEPEIQREAWKEVVNKNGKEVTAAKVQEVVEDWKPVNERFQQLKRENEETIFNPIPRQPIEILEQAKQETARPHVSNNSGEEEWYTPAEYIEAARLAMGGIDLDPATSLQANEVVKAESIFTAEDDGLTKEWFGNVWLNPPYKQPTIAQFCDKIVNEYHNGDVDQAIVLVNNGTETATGQMLLSQCAAVCFPKGRIKYWYPGRDSKTPLQGQMILYFGVNESDFLRQFKKFGVCMTTN